MSFTWSYTALDLFETCPRRFHDRYILGNKEPSTPALNHGNFVHKSAENYLRSAAELPELKGKELIEAVKRQAQGKKLFVEQKMGLTKDLEGCGFFAPEVWGRCASDVIVADYPIAFLIDWKTGKVREKPLQLMLNAAFIFKHFPRINKITALNVFLEHGKFGQMYNFTRDMEAGMWQVILPRIQLIEDAIARDAWLCKPSGLCGYCPVKSCGYNRT